MSDRYQVLTHNKEVQWVKGLPILLSAYVISKDMSSGNILLQCKFQNLSKKILTALSTKIKCFTADGTELQGIERYDYNSLSAASYKNVGENIPIILPDQNTYKVEIIPLSIMLEDEVKWQNEAEEAFQVVVLLRKPIPEYSNEDKESFEYYVEQYKRDIEANVKPGHKHQYLPEFNEDYIICGCGQFVLSDSTTCPNCGIDIQYLKSLQNIEQLKEDIQQYGIDQKKLHHEKQIAEELKKKKRKKRIIVAIITSFVIILGILIPTFFLPYLDYIDANKDYENGRYGTAAIKYEMLDGFLYSENKLENCYYQLANEYKNNSKYDTALTYYKELINSENQVYQNALDSFCTDIYAIACKLYDDGQYTEAEDIFMILKNESYLDSYKYYTLALLQQKKYGHGGDDDEYYIKSYSLSFYVNQIVGFKDGNSVILNNATYLGKFLIGYWYGSGYYFRMDEDGYCSYDLPNNNYDGYYSFEDGIFKIGSHPVFKFEILSSDKIEIYCYKNGSTYTLYR